MSDSASEPPTTRFIPRSSDHGQPKLVVHGHLHWRYTDWVRVSGDAWTRIDGLGGDSQCKRDNPRWRPEDAWMVLDLADDGLEKLLASES